MIQLDAQALSDRAAISDAVIGYATALDTQDWTLFGSLFAETVTVDYRSFDPLLFHTLGRNEWVAMMKARFGGFDATQHVSSNHVHRIDGDSALCTSYMQARHFVVRDADTACASFFGYYATRLVRTSDGWRICHLTLTVTARTGNMQVFQWAQARRDTALAALPS